MFLYKQSQEAFEKQYEICITQILKNEKSSDLGHNNSTHLKFRTCVYVYRVLKLQKFKN